MQWTEQQYGAVLFSHRMVYSVTYVVQKNRDCRSVGVACRTVLLVPVLRFISDGSAE